MKNSNAQAHQTTHRGLLIACVAAVAMVAFLLSLPQPLYAAAIVPPPVPPNLQVPPGNKAFLDGHAVGTQNYICLPSGSSFAWTLFGPQATLFNDADKQDKQIITHFLSPNPEESGMARATWQHSRDTSTVWAMAIASSFDPNFVEAGAIPWLLLEVVGAEAEPTGSDKLAGTTFIQRLNTSGGLEPSAGCAQSTDVGQRAFVPYMADYFFHEGTKSK